MSFRIQRIWLGAAIVALSLAAQDPRDIRTPREQEGQRLPSGRLQSDEILKADFENNMKDVKQMQKMLEELHAELEKNGRHVVSIGALKKLEEVEKLSRQVRGRMRRW